MNGIDAARASQNVRNAYKILAEGSQNLRKNIDDIFKKTEELIKKLNTVLDKKEKMDLLDRLVATGKNLQKLELQVKKMKLSQVAIDKDLKTMLATIRERVEDARKNLRRLGA